MRPPRQLDCRFEVVVTVGLLGVPVRLSSMGAASDLRSGGHARIVQIPEPQPPAMAGILSLSACLGWRSGPCPRGCRSAPDRGSPVAEPLGVPGSRLPCLDLRLGRLWMRGRRGRQQDRGDGGSGPGHLVGCARPARCSRPSVVMTTSPRGRGHGPVDAHVVTIPASRRVLITCRGSTSAH